MSVHYRVTNFVHFIKIKQYSQRAINLLVILNMAVASVLPRDDIFNIQILHVGFHLRNLKNRLNEAVLEFIYVDNSGGLTYVTAYRLLWDLFNGKHIGSKLHKRST